MKPMVIEKNMVTKIGDSSSVDQMKRQFTKSSQIVPIIKDKNIVDCDDLLRKNKIIRYQGI